LVLEDAEEMQGMRVIRRDRQDRSVGLLSRVKPAGLVAGHGRFQEGLDVGGVHGSPVEMNIV
jgi:hypothetical protein